MTAKSSIVSCNNTYFYTHTVFLSFLMWNVGTFCDWRMSNEWSLFSQKNTWWLAQKGTDRKKHGDDNESPVVLLRIYTRSATRRQTVMVDINLLLSHFPRFLVCFATMAAELWRIGPNPDISLTSNIPSLIWSNKVDRVVTSLALVVTSLALVVTSLILVATSLALVVTSLVLVVTSLALTK